MSRKKLERVVPLEKSKTRAAALESIDAALDLGDGLTLAAYESENDKLQKKVGEYNKTLSTVDDLYNEVQAQILVVNDWSERMLAGVAKKYGKNSSQYEMAGGVKKSERKKPHLKKKP